MLLNVRTINGLQPTRTVSVRTSAGLRTVNSISLRQTGGVASGPSNGSASVSPKSASGYANTKVNTRIITSSVTVTVTGGLAPYAIAWVIAGDGWSVTNPSGNSTAFRSPALIAGSDAETTAYATATDSTGLVFTSNTIVVSAGNLGQ